ncbi:PDZ domain-containing protein [candidate division KSB1 bacterium]|nr:PDZ domain-containing protein [candidate division KSB1 bacterium]
MRLASITLFAATLVAVFMFGTPTVAKEGSKAEKVAFFGVAAGEITSEIAADYGVQPGNGVVVESVTGGSPAEQIGLRENDIITRLGGAVITGPEEFRVQIRKHKPDDVIEVTYMRGGKEKLASATLTKRGDTDMMSFTIPTPPQAPKAHAFNWSWSDKDSKHGYAGLVLQELSEGLASYFKVEEGVLISEVVSGSPADNAGLKAGDVVVKVGGESVEDESDIRREIRSREPGEKLEFEVMRDGSTRTITVTLGDVRESEDMGALMEQGVDGGNAWGLDVNVQEMSEEMQRLQEELRGLDMKINIDELPALEELRRLEPMQLDISPVPDAPGIKMEMRRSRPIWDRTVWQESWDRVKSAWTDQMRTWEAGLLKLRDQLAQLRQELMQKFA